MNESTRIGPGWPTPVSVEGDGAAVSSAGPVLSRRTLIAAACLFAGAAVGLTGCAPRDVGSSDGAAFVEGDPEEAPFRDLDLGNGLEADSSLELEHAQGFSIDYYPAPSGRAGAEERFALICTRDGSRILVVPEGLDAPQGIASDVQTVHRPVRDVYLVASNVLCLVDALGEVRSVSVVGVSPENCTVEAFSRAIDAGQVVYGGKYSAPDYELLVDAGCRLAVENTMVNHSPDIRNKLRDLGMAVLVDQSSTEPSVLGRLEWIKLYGELWNKQDLARSIFDEQVARIEEVAEQIARESGEGDGAGGAASPGKTVAFFYINANGAAVTRRPADFVAQMIRMAGGTYAFDEADDDGTSSSTVTLEMERFYAVAKDCDVVVYNATIDDAVRSLDDLLAKNGLLRDFKAVRNGDVWCTERNLYQQMTMTGQIVSDIHRALTDPDADVLEFMHRLV